MTDNGASAITFKYGAVAGESVEGSVIKKCHYPATGSIPDVTLVDSSNNNAVVGKQTFDWKICWDSNFTAGEGEEANVADM